MYSKTVAQIINLFILVSCEIIFEDLSNFPDYGNPSFQRSKDVRQSFINNKKRKYETAKRIKLLDKYLPNNTVYIDEVTHFHIVKNTKNSEWKKVNEFESGFRNIIAMQGLTYTFRRDTFWRTWRLVHYLKKNKVIFYRYENSVNFTNDQDSGYWIIENKPPPCPFELFSLKNENKICAVHINQYHKVKKSCSKVINLSDLTGACDNPIVTEWQIKKRFNDKVSERFPSVICGGRESCTILTLYKISSDYISFKIVNTSNDVIYSRIMKPNKKNYACIKYCGKLNPYLNTIKTSQNSLRINLLGSKNKREDTVFKTMNNFDDVQPSYEFIEKNNYSKPKKFDNYNRVNSIKHEEVTSKAPTCKALKLSLVQDEMDEE